MVRELHETHQRADWRLVEHIYAQVSSIMNDEEGTNIPSELLMGFLAQAAGRVFTNYDGDELLFAEDLLALWRHIDGVNGDYKRSFVTLYHDERFHRLVGYTRDDAVRRKPTPFEAAIETTRRLRDVNSVRDSMADMECAAILGGSSSYGRFLSVRGAAHGVDESSDVDLLIVVDADEGSARQLVEALETLEGVSGTSLESMKSRCDQFEKLASVYEEPCVFSHKLLMWEDKKDPALADFGILGTYRLSLHLLSRTAFDYLILSDMPVLSAPEPGFFTRDLWDFRDTEPRHGHDEQRSFSGIDKTLKRDYFPVDGGYTSKVRACYMEDDRYFPGLLQNLILPQFEIRWDFRRRPIFLLVSGFRWKIVERLREETRKRPFELHRLSQSHTRSSEFAPHVIRTVDSGYQMVL